MSSAIASVIIASAQSVAKVYVIGAVGYFSVLYPKNAPILPRHSVGAVARFGFHALTIPLIYSNIARSVSIDSIGDYWFVLIAGFGVISVSYLVATLLGKLLPLSNPRDFVALRIAATFPNIVALPILIFPSLCEYKVVYDGFATEKISSDADLVQECISQSNTMIFLYFFSWSISFWSLGHPQLMNAAKATQQQKRREDDELQATTRMEHESSRSVELEVELELATIEEAANEEEATTNEEEEAQEPKPPQELAGSIDQRQEEVAETTEAVSSFLHNFGKALKQTCTSPGFLALAAGFITACIPPLQRALFDPNGPLRFLGAAAENLGLSSAAISTMVVAASLVKPLASVSVEQSTVSEEEPIPEENPAMSDPNFGPALRQRRSSLREFRQSMRSGSMRILQSVPRSTPEIRRMHLWFTLSKLILTPAVVVGIILALDDCGAGVLGGVPYIAKLVVIVNSSLPGALIIVVVLKGNPDLSETAAAVAKVYFPSYLLSIITISAWTSVGLYITMPNEEGLTFCERI